MPSHPVVIPERVARRFVLGRQGLWPGRRWAGASGTEQAMRAIEHLQLDPLNITARSQDLMLHARVADYAPEAWQLPAYEERKFFDWGGWLALRPMDELPFFRHFMAAEAQDPGHAEWAAAHADLLEEMRTVLREEGPVSNRDFAMGSRNRVNSYRGRKDSAVALYRLWRTGEVMIQGRDRFERSYDLTERIAPRDLIREAPARAAERFMALKNVAFRGLADRGGTVPLPGDYRVANVRALLDELTHDELLQTVRVEGWRGDLHLLSSDLPLLETLLAGRVPEPWRPVGQTTSEAVTFLSPLDPVAARGRAAKLFGFEYVWEVYKPADKRKWGYYVLPILWGDALVARADMKLDRQANTLQVLGFWLEEPATGLDEAFAAALGRGLSNLQRFLAAEKLDIKAIGPVALRNEVRKAAADG